MTRWPGTAGLLLGALLLTVTAGATADAPDASQVAALRLAKPALEASRSSESVWPGWDISETPLLLLSSDETCLLVHHPRPPIAFRRLLDDGGADLSVYRRVGGTYEEPFSEVGRYGTAVLTTDELHASGPVVVYERAFLVWAAGICDEALEPVDLVAAYPVDARSLVLSDIECEILADAERAVERGAEPAVVESLARELVSIRIFRRIQMGNRFAEYERRLELREGVPRYAAGRMLEEAARRRVNPVFDEAVAACRERFEDGLNRTSWSVGPGTDLEWYRERRFAFSGASVCRLLDRTVPGWKERVIEDCVDPYSLLEERFRLEAPRPASVTPRYDYEARLLERAAFAEEALTHEERRFIELTRGDSLRFCINTHLLSNVSVSYEPTTMLQVDRHRQVHERILRLDFSGTTYLELIGRPCAVIVENDAYDVRQLIFPAPKEFRVTAGGAVVELTHGIQEIDEPHRIEAPGFLLEAERSVVFVSDTRITFVIHR